MLCNTFATKKKESRVTIQKESGPVNSAKYKYLVFYMLKGPYFSSTTESLICLPEWISPFKF